MVRGSWGDRKVEVSGRGDLTCKDTEARNNQQSGKSRTHIKAEMIARGGRERKFQNIAPSGPRRPDSKLGI